MMSWTRSIAPIIVALQFLGAGGAQAASDRARFVAQVVPSDMETGGRYAIMVQFKNTGHTTWRADTGYRMYTLDKAHVWQVEMVPITPAVVKPGATATLRFTVTAPTRPGLYDFQWQIRNRKRAIDGAKSPLLSVNVESALARRQSEFVMQSLPGLVNDGPAFSILKVGQVFPVKIVYKNTGVTTWQAEQLKLVSQNPTKNLTWMLDSVAPATARAVAPGEFVTFEFNANAPTAPGIYDFQWRLQEQDIGEFGEKSNDVKITVK